MVLLDIHVPTIEIFLETCHPLNNSHGPIHIEDFWRQLSEQHTPDVEDWIATLLLITVEGKLTQLLHRQLDESWHTHMVEMKMMWWWMYWMWSLVHHSSVHSYLPTIELVNSIGWYVDRLLIYHTIGSHEISHRPLGY